ncbi:MAG: hypothetical protein WDM91_12870 [Rhizomicrobium sp.]
MGLSSIISAHADYDRSHFIFPRTQSVGLRATPWARRLKPQRSWSEIGLYTAAAVAGTLATVALL